MTCRVNQKKLCGKRECTICFGRSLASRAPDKCRHWSKKNGDVQPWAVRFGAHQICWFDCTSCGHTFDIIAYSITSGGKWCRFCDGKELCNDPSCDTCIKRSFKFHSPERSRCWSMKNKLSASQVTHASKIQYLFHCDNPLCLHEFWMNPSDITNLGNWCPYCANKALCGKDECNCCFEKSFEFHAPERSMCWSIKNKIEPNQVTYGSKKMRWFDCDVCNHRFKIRPNNITCQDQWCSYCANKRLCDDQDCEVCLNKSFKSHDKSSCWSSKNVQSPREVFKYSNEPKRWFDCDKCLHVFLEYVFNVSFGHWCPKCQMCPGCGLWRTRGRLCFYCKPKNKNKLYQKTKEYAVVKFLRETFPDHPFTHNRSVGKECTDGHIFPDIRYDCVLQDPKTNEFIPYFLIVEVDEFEHRGASYECDQRRMHDMVAKLAAPCVLIRYNPDNRDKERFQRVLVETIGENLRLASASWDQLWCIWVIYIGYSKK